ncbi:hypothetical protein [Thermovenabulum sp.]
MNFFPIPGFDSGIKRLVDKEYPLVKRRIKKTFGTKPKVFL